MPGSRVNRFTVSLLVLAGAACGASGQVSMEVVAMSGQTAPGTTDPFVRVVVPCISTAGEIGFHGALGPTWFDDRGLWYTNGGMLDDFVLSGDSAPGTSTYFTGWAAPVLNSSGHMGLVGYVAASFPADIGIWAGSAGHLALIARSGYQAPGFPTGVLMGDSPSNPSFSDGGYLTFNNYVYGSSVTPDTDTAVWLWNGTTIDVLAAEGQLAPGFGDGEKYGQIFDVYPAVNNKGQVVFSSSLTDGSIIPGDNDYAIWFGSASGTELVMQRGAAVPGLTDRYFNNDAFTGGWINDLGQVSVLTKLRNESGAYAGQGLFVWHEGTISTVARPGGNAPGVGSGVTYSGVVGGGMINNAGQVAYKAHITGSGVTSDNDEVIYMGKPSGPHHVVVREGDPAPIPGENLTFKSFGVTGINIRGQVLFVATLDGAGVDATNSGSFWAWDRRDGLMLIAREGDRVVISPGVTRVIGDSWDFTPPGYIGIPSGNADGWPSRISDDGKVVMWATLTDGSDAILLAKLPYTCPADWNRDGTVDINDYLQFLDDFYISVTYGTLHADFNEDKEANTSDVSAFLTAWATGCP